MARVFAAGLNASEMSLIREIFSDVTPFPDHMPPDRFEAEVAIWLRAPTADSNVFEQLEAHLTRATREVQLVVVGCELQDTFRSSIKKIMAMKASAVATFVQLVESAPYELEQADKFSPYVVTWRGLELGRRGSLWILLESKRQAVDAFLVSRRSAWNSILWTGLLIAAIVAMISKLTELLVQHYA